MEVWASRAPDMDSQSVQWLLHMIDRFINTVPTCILGTVRQTIAVQASFLVIISHL